MRLIRHLPVVAIVLTLSGLGLARANGVDPAELDDVSEWEASVIDDYMATYFDFPETTTELTLVGRWPWGTCMAVATRNNLAAYLNGAVLQFSDISNPLSPQLLGSIVTAGGAWDLKVDGTYAYLVSLKAGTRIIDYSNPAAAVEVANLDINGLGIDIVGDLLYVVGLEDGLTIVDVTDRSSPSVIGEWIEERYTDVKVVGNYAYASRFASGNENALKIFDISDPTTPTEVAAIFEPGAGFSVDVDNNRVCVSNLFNRTVEIADVSDPINPTGIQQRDLPVLALFPFDLAVDGDRLFVAGVGGIFEYDLTDPGFSLLEHFFKISPMVVVPDGGLLLLAQRDGGMVLVDASIPGTMNELSFVPTRGMSVNLDIENNHAFVTTGHEGLLSLQHTGADPVEVGRWPPPGQGSFNTRSVDVDGGRAIVQDGSDVRTFDVSDPTNLTLEHEMFGMAANLVRLFPGTSVGYISRYSNSLETWELSGTPTFLDSTPWPSFQIMDLELGPGAISYASSLAGALDTLFGFGHQNFQWPGGIDVNSTSYALTLDHPIVFQAARDFVSSANVSDPQNITPLGTTSVPGRAVDVEFSDDNLFVAVGGAGVRVYNKTNPAQLSEVAYYQTDGFANDVAVLGDYLYVTDIGDGVYVFDVSSLGNVSAPELTPENVGVELWPNHPNPFNPSTTIRFEIDVNATVQLHIYDVAGREIRRLIASEWRERGFHTAAWDGRDQSGKAVVSGTYFYRLRAGNSEISRKMVLVR